jgi:hypothetical protein
MFAPNLNALAGARKSTAVNLVIHLRPMNERVAGVGRRAGWLFAKASKEVFNKALAAEKASEFHGGIMAVAPYPSEKSGRKKAPSKGAHAPGRLYIRFLGSAAYARDRKIPSWWLAPERAT